MMSIIMMFLIGTGMMLFMGIHIIIHPMTGTIIQGIIRTTGINPIVVGITIRACTPGIGTMIIIGTTTRVTIMITIIMAITGQRLIKGQIIKDHSIGVQAV